MDFNRAELLNSSSFLEQKMNLTSGEKNKNIDSSTYEKELFIIPRFTVVGFPMQNTEKTSYYYIELQVLEAYCYDLDINKEKEGGVLNDITFQYDLNYSNVEQARGQITISKSIQFWILTQNCLQLLENNKLGPYAKIGYYHMFMKTYKIILPAAAIKKNSINILNYKF